MLEIKIAGEPKEIADLVEALQDRQKQIDIKIIRHGSLSATKDLAEEAELALH